MADVLIAFSGASDQGEESDGPFRVTNTAGWSAFSQWASEAGPALHDLVTDGKLAGTDRLAAELSAADPPVNLKGIAETLIEFVGVGDADETAVVGDDLGE